MDKIFIVIMQFIRTLLDVVAYKCWTIVYSFVEKRVQWFTGSGNEQGEKSLRHVPGPTSLPFLGTTWLFIFGGWKFTELHKFGLYLYRQYGSVVKEEALFNIPIVNVFEREDIEKVMKCNSKYPVRPPIEALAHYRRSRPDRYVSVGLVNEQGSVWHHLRQSLTGELVSPRTISDFTPQVEAIAQDWCDLLKDHRDKNGRVENMEELAGRLGLEISCALVLGRRMGFLLDHRGSELTSKFEKAVQNYFIAIRDTYFGLPFWKVFPTNSYRKLVESEETIYELASHLISTADDSVKDSAVFQSVLRARIDEKEKRAAIIDFITAGIHTLKNSLLYLLHFVANDKNTQAKVVEDSTMTYTKACVTESFRYCPTANALARVIEEDMDLGGYKIKAGTVVVCHTGIACRSEKNFKNAGEYRPERWLAEEKTDTSTKSTFLVVPFGAGRRICPGKRVIEKVLSIILRNTVQAFDMSVNGPLESKFEFLLSPISPVVINFQDRY